METLSSFFDQIQVLATDLVSSCIYGTLIFGSIGLLTSIILLVYAKKRNLIKRDNALWAFIVKLNYVFMPLCFSLFFGCIGFIVGGQYKVYQWVDTVTAPLVDYSILYVPAIQKLGISLESSLTMEEIVGLEVFGRSYISGTKGTINKEINRAIILSLLDEFNYPHEVDSLVRLLRSSKLSTLDVGFCQRIPYHVKSYCNIYFFQGYAKVWSWFYIFLLAPFIELFVYVLYKQVGKTYVRTNF